MSSTSCSFESLYYRNGFDICTHCNLYQDHFDSCESCDVHTYRFRCNHCHQLFFFNNENNNKKPRTLLPEIRKLAQSYVIQREMEDLKRKYQW